MTAPMINLRALVEKAPDLDIVRDMIGFGAQRLIEVDMGALIGAARGGGIRSASPPTLSIRGQH